jgi:hypothetical protein
MDPSSTRANRLKRNQPAKGHHADHEIELLTELNEAPALVPSDFTPAATTAMIIANITLYSMAVGPSSLSKKHLIFEIVAFILSSLFFSRLLPSMCATYL